MNQARSQKTVNILIISGIILVGVTAYFSSFSAPFIFDDRNHIHNNPRVQTLWPPWVSMRSTNRPVTSLTLAMNFALGKFQPQGYHAFNIIMHILSGLMLFAVMKRTLNAPRLKSHYADRSSLIACVVTFLWLLHPLHTQAVSYIIQRSEVLMGFFYFLTLYCVIRCAGPQDQKRAGTWGKAAVLSCVLGMGSKEVMGSAPVVVLLYDRVFWASSWKEIIKRRGWVYIGLALTWIILAVLIMTPRPNDTVAGPAFGLVPPFQYFKTQTAVIVHYIRLAFYPANLCFFYSWTLVVDWSVIWPYFGLTMILGLLTVYALWRIPPLGFLGIWFFFILAPTSSFVPIADVIMEYRMYLPVLAPVIVAVLFLDDMMRRCVQSSRGQRMSLSVVSAVLISLLGGMTIQRNLVYKSEFALWNDVLAKRPPDDMAYLNLGVTYARENQWDKAIEYYQKALAVNPGYDKIYYNLGAAWAQNGDPESAKKALSKSLELNANVPGAHTLLGLMAVDDKDLELARQHFAQAVEIDPENPQILNNYGLILYQLGKTDLALEYFWNAVNLDPNSSNTHYNLGLVYFEKGRVPEAVDHFKAVLKREPQNVNAHYNLGTALANSGLITESAYHFERVMELDPEFQDVSYRLRTLRQILRGEIPESVTPPAE